ncbi:MAG: SurA N-terminal domain-containing protein [Planctomycetes bacterium]|nr:SurA N-terminal domain-containing protein [Planctomycetota bacterium]
MANDKHHLDEKPLDLEVHEGETPFAVWSRRLMFLLLIVLCVSFAAPAVGSCSGALGSGGSKLWGTFEVAGQKFDVHEAEFQRLHARYAAVFRLFDPQGQRSLSNDEVWSQVILDEVAKAEGIHVSDDQIAKFIAMHPAFQSGGKFAEDKYRAEMKNLARYAGVDHEGFTSGLKSILRTEIYRGIYASAFTLPQSREAYDEWKKTNTKITVDYVVQPFSALREKARTLPVTDEDLRRAAILPDIVEMRTTPARRGIEAAYVRVHEVTPEQRAAMQLFVESAGLLPKDQSLEAVAWREYFSNKQEGGPYTRQTWIAAHRPAYEKELAAWTALPEPRPEASKPVDPSTVAWPEKPSDVFYKQWRGAVEIEVLGREVLRNMASRAEREGKAFADLLPEFAAMGVRVTSTPEPLTDAELVTKFPEGLGRESELEQAVRTRFRLPEGGAKFAPTALPDPVPACRVSDKPLERGWIALRWTSYEPARERDVLEIREKATDAYRAYRATELARDTLVEIRKKVEDAGGDVAAKRAALRKLAGEAGLSVQEIRRFNARTEKPRPQLLAEDATQDAREAADRAVHRSRIQDDYPLLSKQEAGKIRDPILLDERTLAAYLILLVDKSEPGPIEMDAATLRNERMMRSYQSRTLMGSALGAKELKSRYRMVLTPDGKAATEKDSEKSTESN